jgi:hypothetical protein
MVGSFLSILRRKIAATKLSDYGEGSPIRIARISENTISEFGY